MQLDGPVHGVVVSVVAVQLLPAFNGFGVRARDHRLRLRKLRVQWRLQDPTGPATVAGPLLLLCHLSLNMQNLKIQIFILKKTPKIEDKPNYLIRFKIKKTRAVGPIL